MTKTQQVSLLSWNILRVYPFTIKLCPWTLYIGQCHFTLFLSCMKDVTQVIAMQLVSNYDSISS